MPHGPELGTLSLMAFKTLNLHLQPFISNMYTGRGPSSRPGQAVAGGSGRVAPPPLLYRPIYSIKAVIKLLEGKGA